MKFPTKASDALAPVFRFKRPYKSEDSQSRTTTTHDVHGGGDPHLVMIFSDSIDLDLMADDPSVRSNVDGGDIPKRFSLLPGVTTIGSDWDNDISLPGLEPHHAEVRRDKYDEYCMVDLSHGNSAVDGRRGIDGVPLRTGRRVGLGEYTLIYCRAEFADHGHPFGGHQGGEFDGYPTKQMVPRPRGTSPSGGSEPTATDPGEYY